jgi:hypothetical protein
MRTIILVLLFLNPVMKNIMGLILVMTMNVMQGLKLLTMKMISLLLVRWFLEKIPYG